MARALKTDKDLWQGGRGLFAALARDVLRREDGTLNGQDIEELHQMRARANRLRTAVRLLGKSLRLRRVKAWNKDLRWLAKGLGLARDLDVMIEHLDALAGARPAARLRPGYEFARDALWRKRQEGHAALRELLLSEKWRRIRDRLERLAAKDKTLWRHGDAPADVDPLEAFPPVIAAAVDGYRAARADLLEAATPETFHEFRLAGKRIRYVCEFFKPRLGREGRRMVNFWTGLSDCLGDLHDLEILESRLLPLRYELLPVEKGQAAEAAKSLAGLETLIARSRRRRERLLERFETIWRRLDGPRGVLARLDALQKRAAQTTR